MSALAISGLTVRYGKETVVDDVSLTVAPGEVLGLVGESGSGKTTVALAAMGLLSPDAAVAGRVLLGDDDMIALPERARDRLRGRAAGMVFQEPMTALNPVMTVGAQVAEAVRLQPGTGRREVTAQVAALLERVGVEHPGRYPHQLSGGQRQRVAIAMAIAGKPRLLIADEPTTALDMTTQARIAALLVELVRERDMGLLLVSHDLPLVGSVADRVAVMQGGRVVEQGSAAALLSAPRTAYAQHLLAKTRHVPTRAASISDSGPLLEVNELTHRYNGSDLPALDGVSLTVRAGETLGVVGESGSGKTTLLRSVLGLIRPQAGAVILGGERDPRRWRRQVQAVFQDPVGSFDPRWRVGRAIAEPLHLLAKPLAPREIDARVSAALEAVGLRADAARRYPHEFSGGQRQRLAIARALILEPALVVLDEAVSALDVSIRADVLDLLAALQARTGTAFLFVSHDLSVMRVMTDRLVVLKDGRVVEEGETAALLARPQHPYTRSLIAAAPALASAT